MTFASRFLGQALKLPPVASRDIDVQRDLRARMPDGVVLLADRYAPQTRPWPLRPPPPLILVRSPYVTYDREHTDFFARLCDVSPTGMSLNICDALLRLAPGRPERQPDGTIHTQIPLWPAAHRFRRGHRLRLQVSSGAHPRYARNPGTGEPLGAAVRLAPARQQVFHDPGHPSALILPVPP